jgi:serine/threonine protein phosphatase 1
MNLLKRLSQGLSSFGSKPARGKDGCRAYAVGDIHGRLDLLSEMLSLIEADIASQPPARTYIVFLGDFIDRGPESAGVIERLRTYSPSFAKPIFLAGNHEEVLLRVLAGDSGVLGSWLKFGGAECAQSYGLDLAALQRTDELSATRMLRAKVPASHVRFLEGLADTFRFGDYLFVHAGIRPGILLEEEKADLRWIREAFLKDDKEHGFIVVHGHTIVPEVEERKNRIGIDTGAYRTGVLTALVIEEEVRRYLRTGASGAVPPSGVQDQESAVR